MTGAAKQRLTDIGALTRDELERNLEGKFRGTGTNAAKPTNMFRKGSDLVKSHHVLALRLGQDRSALTMLIGAVVIATYRRGCYHVCAEYRPSTKELLRWYCTCFAGEAKCIHLAAVFFALARYDKQPIRDFEGEKGLCVSAGDTIAQFSRDKIKDTLSWVEANRFLDTHLPHVLVHNLALEQKTYLELRNLCDLIRRWRQSKKGKRGAQAYGAQLEKLSVKNLRKLAEDKGIEIGELIEEAKAAREADAGSKLWMRKKILICLAERDDPDDPDCEAAVLQLELDVCPCDDLVGVTADGNVECPSCRQWWHLECTGLQLGQDTKSFKKCKTCMQFLDQVADLKAQNKFGLFKNDWDDLHK